MLFVKNDFGVSINFGLRHSDWLSQTSIGRTTVAETDILNPQADVVIRHHQA